MRTPPDDEPITLKEACEIRYRNRIKVASLRSEIERGRLDILRIGRTDFTTLRKLREMERRCRVEKQARASTSIDDGDNGLSETEYLLSAQAALAQTVQRLKGNSPNTSDGNTVHSKVKIPW